MMERVDLEARDLGAVWLKTLRQEDFEQDRFDDRNQRSMEARELPRTLLLGALGETPKVPLLWRHGENLVVYGPRNERLAELSKVQPLHEPALSLAALERAARTLNPWQTGTERWDEIARAVFDDCGVQLQPWLKHTPAMPSLVKRDLAAPSPARWTREPELVERARSWLTELAERDVVSHAGAHALALAALPRADLVVQRHELPHRLDFTGHLGKGVVVRGTLWRFTGEPSGTVHYEPPPENSTAVQLDGSDLRLHFTHAHEPLLAGVAT